VTDTQVMVQARTCGRSTRGGKCLTTTTDRLRSRLQRTSSTSLLHSPSSSSCYKTQPTGQSDQHSILATRSILWYHNDDEMMIMIMWPHLPFHFLYFLDLPVPSPCQIGCMLFCFCFFFISFSPFQ